MNEQVNIYNNEDWVMRPESVAKTIIGEETKLGSDILIYFKMAAYTQGVLDRIAKSVDKTLADEIATDSGFVMMGNPEKIRTAMHTWIDQLVDGVKKVTV